MSFLRAIADQVRLRDNAPQWSAAAAGLISAWLARTLGFEIDPAWTGVLAVVIGATLGWVVQKLYTVPKSSAVIPADNEWSASETLAAEADVNE